MQCVNFMLFYKKWCCRCAQLISLISYYATFMGLRFTHKFICTKDVITLKLECFPQPKLHLRLCNFTLYSTTSCDLLLSDTYRLRIVHSTWYQGICCNVDTKTNWKVNTRLKYTHLLFSVLILPKLCPAFSEVWLQRSKLLKSTYRPVLLPNKCWQYIGLAYTKLSTYRY